MTTREQDSTVTYEKGNNYFVATVPKGGTNDYEGSDELYFYIRDTFDLD